MQQYAHASEVVGGDVLFLAVNLVDAMRPHALAHIEQQRVRPTGEIHHAFQALLFPGGGFLAVARHDGREDVGNLLRRVELARLLARAGGKLAHQVFISLAQCVNVGGELRQTLGDFSDDGAELRIALRVLLA